MTFLRFFVPLVFLVTSAQAFAEEPSKLVPVVSVTAAVGYGVSLKSGAALPSVIIHGVGFLMSLSDDWGYYGEAAMASAFSEFKPGLQLITGPVRKLGDETIGITGMYKMQPAYDGVSPFMHSAGISIAPGFKTPLGRLSVPMGVVYNVSTDDLSVVFSIKASARLF